METTKVYPSKSFPVYSPYGYIAGIILGKVPNTQQLNCLQNTTNIHHAIDEFIALMSSNNKEEFFITIIKVNLKLGPSMLA